MKPEHWQQIKMLLQSALERDPDQRSAFLTAACAGDESLRKEVESLIISHDQAGAFIENPAFEVMADSLADNQAESLIGQTLGHYMIREQLGAGGMGEVYLAQDTRLDRKVALKLLPAFFTTEDERVRRFEQEARAASALNHPNILTIYEIGQIDSRRFIATEFIEGETLRQRMAQTPIKIVDALDAAAQVASALAVAHHAGIAHRDIKPENIMLRQDGFVKVVDFGVAKLTEPKTGESEAVTLLNTKQGTVIGTAHYMSPEQARGLQIDTRTDIWSLGVVLYEMIGGRVPFEGTTSSDVIASILNQEPNPLARYSADVPIEIEWIVKKALRKDREERYQTAKELLTDLKNLKHRLEFEDELGRFASPELAHPTTGGGQRTETTKEQAAQLQTLPFTSQALWSRWAVLMSLAVGVLMVFAVLGYLWLQSRRQNREATTPLKNATFTQLTDQPGPEFFPSLSPDGKSFVYASHVSGNWDIYLQRVGGRNSTNLTKNSLADDTQPAFSPDGERIAFRSEREGGGIFVMEATGESVRRVADTGYNPAWAPDGEKIIFATETIVQPLTRPTNSQLWTIKIATGEKRLITEGDALQPQWSPHEYRIAYWTRPKLSGQGEDIWTMSAAGGETVRVTSSAATNWNPIWSPDGNYLYFSSNRGGSMNIWRVALDEKSGAVLGQPEAVTTIGAATAAQHLSFSRAGRLAYVAQEQIKNLRKVAFDPVTGKTVGEPLAITQGSMQFFFPDPSPDGQWLTCHSAGNQRHIFIMRTDGSDPRDLTPDAYRYSWPRWSPDGKRIAFSSRRSGDFELWLIDRDGSGLRQLTETRGAHYSPWSPDGSKIAYSIHNPKNDCAIFQPDKAWSEQTPEYLPSLSDPTVAFEAWSWSPGGKRLAGIRHMFGGIHAGIGIYDLASRHYDWLTDFGDYPLWLKDNQRILFVSQGKILLFDTKSRKYQQVLLVTNEDVDIGSLGLSTDNRMIYFTYVETQADIWLMTP